MPKKIPSTSPVINEIIEEAIHENTESKGVIKRDDLGRFLPGNPPGPGWKNRAQESQILAKLRDDLLSGSEEAIQVLRDIIRKEDSKDNIKVNAAKILIQCAKIIPDQVFHESWKMILNKSISENTHGLADALPQFKQYLQWKMQQDRDRIIEAERVEPAPEQAEDAGNGE